MGFLYMIGLQIMGSMVLSALGLISMGFVALVGMGSYFVGGVIVGKRSPGKTIKEPAIAAVLAVALNLLLSGNFNIMFLIFGSMIPFFSALAGGYVGEKWQGTI